MKKARTDFPEYIAAFEDELDSFKKRVKGRAEARIEKAMEEAEKVCLRITGIYSIELKAKLFRHF